MDAQIRTFVEQFRLLVAEFNAWALQFQPDAKPDHICYRCTLGEYETRRNMFGNGADDRYFHESEVAGRRISVIELPEPIETVLGPIRYLELSEALPPGTPSHMQRYAADHIEIVPNTGTIDELAAELNRKAEAGGSETRFVDSERPHHRTFDAKIGPPGRLIYQVRLEPAPLIAKIAEEQAAR